MLLTSSIPNLINGVSQQPATLRLASQAEEQVNFLSSVADGLTMRPGTRHLAKLSTANWNDAFIHTINRDVSERYVVVIREGSIRVFDAVTGAEKTVNTPMGVGYLVGASKADYRAVTVADYTFILNRQRVVEAKPVLSPARPNNALVHVRAGNYGKFYRIFINDVERAFHLTPDGSSASHVSGIGTDFIAGQLLNALTTSAPAGFNFYKQGSMIVVNRNDNTPFTIRVEDEAGGVNMTAIHSRVQRFSDLPKDAPNGFTVEIVGDQSSSFDNYYVKYVGATNSTGVWEETLNGGEKYLLNEITMPHVLVREANGTFTYKTATWEPREIGDLERIPFPSFTDRKLRDIFFFQNRLGLIADENVIMSQDGEYFDFFRATATTTLDTDPIDVAVTSDRVSLLNFAVPFNKTLLLFSDQTQFVLEGGDTLTAQNASVAQATAFESLPNVRPVGVGQYVYFPVPRGSHTALREYFVQQGNEQNDALDVTSHVPRYLPKNIFKLAASSSEDTLIALSTDTPNSMWVYRYFFNNEGKLQSAWSEWRFSTEDSVLSVEFIDGRLYLIMARSDGTYLEYMSLESGFVDYGSSVAFRVDRGVASEVCTFTYDAVNDWTDITLPYPTDVWLSAIVRGDDTQHPEGFSIPVLSKPAANTLRFLGNWVNAKLVIGQAYLAKYVFSTFFMRSSEPGGGVSANADGRLQLRYLAVDYSNAGYFKLVSQPTGRDRTEKVFSGRVLGIQSGEIGTFNLATGRFRIPVMCRNTDARITIETDSFLPASFTAAEWEATFTSRARKV